MREIRKKSAAPIYGVAVVWLLYCLLFPLIRLLDFLLLVGISAGAFAVLSLLFPGKTELVKEPEKPVSTGNTEIDMLLAEGKRAVDEMSRLRDSIKEPGVREKTNKIIEVTEKIFKDVLDDPADYKQVKHFADFYLPTTIKLLHTYDLMGRLDGGGSNVKDTIKRIDDILDTTLEGYRKQLDALFANEALDIETDIEVLKSMLKKEGLTGRDF
jgi:5-bromo-4-chloroindolyl phosphate hydrolysis protein